MQNVYIVSAVRTPQGSFGSSLSAVSATQLGAVAIKGAIEKSGISPDHVQEVMMGNVVSANLGQAPARQAALAAGLAQSVPCTTINKVCASGMKAIMFAAQSIMLGLQDVVVAGGMESMSNIPYYLPKARWGSKYGHAELVDGLVRDGLTDAYDHTAMGISGDHTAEKYQISREAQDQYAIRSYQRAADAVSSGKFKEEIVPVSIPQRKGADLLIAEDEEYKKVKFEKIPTLKPVFTPNGTVTAANASTLNDGASALLLVSEPKIKELNLEPLARIVSFADAAQEPKWFTTAPAIATPKALKIAGLNIEQIDFFEVNEAFSVVPLAFGKLLSVETEKMNIHGGGVSLGHPLGASGARIVCSLTHILTQQKAKYGLATLCNGGGGASAMIIERL